jgi:hypothetical protein
VRCPPTASPHAVASARQTRGEAAAARRFSESRLIGDDFTFLLGLDEGESEIVVEKLANAAGGEGQTVRDNSRLLPLRGYWRGLRSGNQLAEAQMLLKPRQGELCVKQNSNRRCSC